MCGMQIESPPDRVCLNRAHADVRPPALSCWLRSMTKPSRRRPSACSLPAWAPISRPDHLDDTERGRRPHYWYQRPSRPRSGPPVGRMRRLLPHRALARGRGDDTGVMPQERPDEVRGTPRQADWVPRRAAATVPESPLAARNRHSHECPALGGLAGTTGKIDLRIMPLLR